MEAIWGQPKETFFYVDPKLKECLDKFNGAQYDIKNYLSEDGPVLIEAPREQLTQMAFEELEDLLNAIGCQIEPNRLVLSKDVEQLVKNLIGKRVMW